MLAAAIDPEREDEVMLSSSFLVKATYSIDINTLELEMGGRVYPYCNVPRRTFDGLIGAASPGAFFNRNIKGIYDC